MLSIFFSKDYQTRTEQNRPEQISGELKIDFIISYRHKYANVFLENKMELTRNLYRLEEVQSAFIHSMINGRLKEAFFWAEEILASDCGWFLGKGLYHCWLWHVCPHDLNLVKIIKELDYEGHVDKEIIGTILRLHAGIVKMKGTGTDTRMSPVFQLMVNGIRSHPPGISTSKPNEKENKKSVERSEKTGLSAETCHAIAEAGRRGCVGRQWYFVSRAFQQDEDGIKTLLPLLVRGDKAEKTALREAVNILIEITNIEKMEDWILPILCAVCCLTSSRSNIRKKILRKPAYPDEDIPNHMKSIKKFIRIQGKREGRVFAIPIACLYGTTERGRLDKDYETIDEIRDIWPSIKNGTPFWKRITAEYQIENDDAKEAFYDTWFPNDIPDEWSLSDQEKSHGECILPVGEVVSVKKFVETYFNPFSKNKVFGIYWRSFNGSDNLLDFRKAYSSAKTMPILWSLA